MSGFLKAFFGGTSNEPARLPAEVQASHDVVDHDDEQDVAASVRTADDKPQDPFRLNRPAAFVDDIYPPIPEPREFSTTEVWRRGEVTENEQEAVERAQQLLEGLPPETSRAVKRQIVDAAFNAFEVSIEDIVSAARHETEALRDYITDANERAERFKTVSEERIVDLQVEIERIRGTIRDAEDERAQLIGCALEVIENVEPVIKFFGDESRGSTGTLPPPVARPATANPAASAQVDTAAVRAPDVDDVDDAFEGDDTVVADSVAPNSAAANDSATANATANDNIVDADRVPNKVVRQVN